MIKAIWGKLTFANVMVLVAIFLALGGTVYAGSKISGKTIKKGSVPGNRIKKNSLTGTQINEAKLGAVPLATNAGSAQPVAFAHVNVSAPVLDTARSKNVGSATRPGGAPAIVCFSGIPFTPRGGQATVDFVGSGFDAAQFGLGDDSGTCPSGTQAFAFSFITSSGTPAAEPMYVLFYG
jgi:hypothetical protein